MEAAPPTYAQVKKLPFGATRMLADPIRPRVYATLREQNSLLVIDTSTLETTALLIGSSPFGLAISQDGSKLYVANSGSMAAGIAVVNLDTLQKLPDISTPAFPFDIAAGANGVLYLTPSWAQAGLIRLDTKDGTSATFNTSGFYQQGLLQISPDRMTLYVTNTGSSPAVLADFDVAANPPELLQIHSTTGSDPSRDIKLSHDGTFLAAPSGDGNHEFQDVGIIPTSNLDGVVGTLQVGPYPSVIAFSFDDQIAYQIVDSQSAVVVFDLSTFTSAVTINVAPGSSYIGFTDITAEPSNRYLFVATTGFQDAPPAIYVYDLAPTAERSYPLNISTRIQVGSADNVAVGGFIIQGGATKRLLLRGLGPSLETSGIAHPISDPRLRLLDAAGKEITNNDDWNTDYAHDEIVASGLQPSSVWESAFVVSALPGVGYTAVLENTAGMTGVGLIEVYDLDAQPAPSKLANISTRGRVGIGNNVMIGGFILGGNGNFSSTVVVRAIGPSLTQAGVKGALGDPLLQLYDANGTLLSSNDNWKDGQPAEIEQVGLQPTDDAESAIFSVLNPGAYTAIVRGAHNGAGVGLVEVYNLQQ